MNTTVQQEDTQRDPSTDRMTAEQASSLVSPPSWADRSEYRRRIEDDDTAYWICDTATISATDVARVSMERQTVVADSGTVTYSNESVRVGHADEEFWIETRHLSAVLAEIRTAAASVGVAL